MGKAKQEEIGRKKKVKGDERGRVVKRREAFRRRGKED